MSQPEPICRKCKETKPWSELSQKFVGDDLHITCRQKCDVIPITLTEKEKVMYEYESKFDNKDPNYIDLDIPEKFDVKYSEILVRLGYKSVSFNDLVENDQQFRDATVWFHFPDDTDPVIQFGCYRMNLTSNVRFQSWMTKTRNMPIVFKR